MIEGVFKVRSLDSIGTREQDSDLGVVRVPGALLEKLGGRNSLVRITRKADGDKRSLVRLVRASTGAKCLLKDEIALQYDDRVTLGVNEAGTEHSIRLQKVHGWLQLPSFLLNHTSPLVRREAFFALAMTIVGTVAGFFIGLLWPK